MNKIKNYEIKTALIFAISGLIIGSFYDLDLNKLLYMRGNIIPNFFKATGEIPMIVLCMVSSFIIFRYKYHKIHKSLLILLACIFFLAPIGSSLSIQSYFNINNIFITIIISTLYIITATIIAKNIKANSSEEKILIAKYSIFILISCILVLISYNTMKVIWGRMRFFVMLNNNDYSGFTNWWKINGKPISDLYKSFPSGHTAAATTTFTIYFLPKVFSIKNKKAKLFFLVFPLIWSISVAISRLLDGAHFLSDVSMAILLDLIIIKTLYYLLFKKNSSIISKLSK